MRTRQGGAKVGLAGLMALTAVVVGDGLCQAAPRSGQPLGGSSIVIRVRGVREKGVRLPHSEAGWALKLEMPADGSQCAADLRDVTPLPTGLLKWTERLSNEESTTRILLTPDRYVPGHAYRLTVRCGARELSRTVVYLAPGARGTRSSQIALSEAEAAVDQAGAQSDDDNELATVPKGSL